MCVFKNKSSYLYKGKFFAQHSTSMFVGALVSLSDPCMDWYCWGFKFAKQSKNSQYKSVTTPRNGQPAVWASLGTVSQRRALGCSGERWALSTVLWGALAARFLLLLAELLVAVRCCHSLQQLSVLIWCYKGGRCFTLSTICLREHRITPLTLLLVLVAVVCVSSVKGKGTW